MLKHYYQSLMEGISSSWKKNRNFLIANWIFGVFLYLTLLSQQLTNHYDGLWSSSYYAASQWELSIGRWLWLYIDRMRARICSDPFNSYLALILLVIGITLILDIFHMLSRKCAYLISFTFLSSTIVSVFLSYRYMSPTFGLSFLLSVLAAWSFIKYYKCKIAVPLSSLFIAMSMGCYQANLACTCLLLVAFYITESLNQRADFKYIGKCILTILLGGVVYKAIWMFHLAVFHIQPASYNGADSITIKNIIIHFPARFILAYKEFFAYFFHLKVHHNIFQKTPLFAIIFFIILICLAILFKKALKANMKSGFLGILAIVLIPAACNVSVLLATEANISIQMTAAMALFIPVMLCILIPFIGKVLPTLSQGLIFCIAFVLYGNIYMTAIDLEAMREGRNATYTMANTVIDTLAACNYLDADTTYMFVGIPSENPLFQVTGLWEQANPYAQFGRFFIGSNGAEMSYQGIFRELGVNIKIISTDEYYRMLNSNIIRNMPIFPAEQSIQKIDDYVVIKLSNTY